MNGYICNKPCKFGGVAYSVGDTIPFESVLPCRERALVKQGFISPVTSELSNNTNEVEVEKLHEHIAELESLLAKEQEPQAEGETSQVIIIPIMAKGELLELEMSSADIVLAISTIQMKPDDAVNSIKSIDKEEVLILIDTLESRKAIKSAVGERAGQINNSESSNEEAESTGDV